MDVVVGEILTGFVQKVHPVEFEGDLPKVDVSLRALGTDAVKSASDRIMNALLDDETGGIVPLGDRSSSVDIGDWFPGVTKTLYKKAVGRLYKAGKIERPEKDEIRLLRGKGGGGRSEEN